MSSYASYPVVGVGVVGGGSGWCPPSGRRWVMCSALGRCPKYSIQHSTTAARSTYMCVDFNTTSLCCLEGFWGARVKVLLNPKVD